MSSKPIFSTAAVLLSASFASAAPLTWGGGNLNISDGAPLVPTSGLWIPDLLENWSLETGTATPTDFSVWSNPNEAAFVANDTSYIVDVGGTVALTGLSTKVADGAGTGPVQIRGADAAVRTFNLASGSFVDTAAGTTLHLRSDATHALSFVTSAFSKTGAGLLVFDSNTVGNSNTPGIISVEEGTLRVLGDRAGIFSNQSLFLNSAAAVFEAGQLASSNGGTSGVQFASFDGVEGSQISGFGAGVSQIAWLNSAADGVVENVLLTDGAPGSRLGLVKAGNKTLTLNHANAYTGGTTVINGRLIAGVDSAVPGVVSVTGSGVFEPADTGSGPSAISVEAGGKLILKSTVNPATLTLLDGGNLEIPTAAALPAGPRSLPFWAGTLTFGYPLDQASLLAVPATFPGIIALGTGTAENLDFSAAGAGLTSARLAASGAVTYSGLLTPSGNTYRLGGGGTLTLDQTAALTGENHLDIGYESVWLRAALPTASLVSLIGANDLSGIATVSRFHTLRLEGASGSLASIGEFRIKGGTVSLLDALDAGNGNRIGDETPVTFSRGGTLTYLGTRGVQEQVGEIRVESGEANVTAGGTGIGTSGTGVIRFTGLGARGDTSTITLANGTNNSLRFASQPPLINGTVGGWSITGGANFTDVNPTNGQPRQITPVVLGSDAAYEAVTATGNYTFDAAVAITTAKNRSVNSLRAHFATGGPFLVDLGPPSTPEAPNLLILESGGLLLSSNIGGSIAGGALTAGEASGYKLFAFAPATAANSAKTVAAPITDNGAAPVKLIKAGAGQLILTAENSYTGGTHLNNGNLQIASSANQPVLSSGPVSFDGIGTILSLGNNISPRTFGNEIQVNADSTFSVPSGQGINVTFSGPISLAADALWTVSGNVTTLSGPITGDGALRFTQGATHTISGSGSNTFSGGLSLNAGTLVLSKSDGALAIGGDVSIGDTDGAFAQEILTLGGDEQIADSAILTLSGADNGNQGIFRLNGNRTETIGGLVGGSGHGVVENGGAAGTAAVLNLANSTNTSFGGILRNDGSGDVTRSLALHKSGSGTQRLAGSSLHTGPTTVTDGTLQIDGLLPLSDLLVEANATLSGTGNIGSAAVINGRHQPGSPAGSQNFTGGLTYGPAAHLVIALGSDSTAEGFFGAVSSSGTINVITGAVVDVKLNPAGGSARFASAFWQVARSWRVVGAGNLQGTFRMGSVSNDATGATAAGFGSFALSNDAAGATLAWTPSGSAPDALQSWRLTHFNTSDGSGGAADLQDPDGDGLSNLLEFVLGTLPKSSNAPGFVLNKNGAVLEFRYRRNKAAALHLNPIVQWSEDLTTWNTTGVNQTVLTDDGTDQEVSATVPLGTSGKRFVQLKAVAP